MENGVPIRSVSRTISVLQAINRHGSLSMTAIARHERLPYPTAFRIVHTLIHEGLIEQEPVRKLYRPTALVQSLAQGYTPQMRIAEMARHHMSDFTRETGWPMFVSVPVGTQMVVRDSTHGETSLTFALCHPGFTVPLLSSATGYAMLSTIPDEDLDDLVGWATRERLNAATVELEPLRALIGRVRANGFAAKACASNTRSSSIAVPIPTDGPSEAVLTLTYFSAAMKEQTAIERYVQRMHDTVAQIVKSFAAATVAA